MTDMHSIIDRLHGDDDADIVNFLRRQSNQKKDKEVKLEQLSIGQEGY